MLFVNNWFIFSCNYMLLSFLWLLEAYSQILGPCLETQKESFYSIKLWLIFPWYPPSRIWPYGICFVIIPHPLSTLECITLCIFAEKSSQRCQWRCSTVLWIIPGPHSGIQVPLLSDPCNNYIWSNVLSAIANSKTDILHHDWVKKSSRVN